MIPEVIKLFFSCSTYAWICSFSSLAIFCGCCVRPGRITTNGPEVIKLFFSCSTYAWICSSSSLAIFCGCCVRPGRITTNGPEVIKLFFSCSTYAWICSFSSLAIFCGCCVRPGRITTNGPEVIKLFFMLNLCLNMQFLVSSHLLWLLCQTWSDYNKWPRGYKTFFHAQLMPEYAVSRL